MKILFLQNFWHEHLGTMYLSSVLKSKGHQVAVGIGRDYFYLKDKIKSFSPNLIGFSCTTGDHLWALEVASKIKASSNIPIVFGGPHSTYTPDIIENRNVDYACVGEGEGVIADLVTSLKNNEDPSAIPNLMLKKDGTYIRNSVRPLINNLDDIPFPDRSIYYDNFKFINDNPIKHFMAGRGCMFECNYCYNHLWMDLYKGKGHVVRYHSPEYCIEEILEVKKRYPLELVVFEDDTFTANKKWLMHFLELYRSKVQVPFACNVQAVTVTEEVANSLGKAGCFRINMGLESGDENLRYIVLNKKVSDEHIIKAAERLHRNKIRILTNNMLGLPGETLENAFKTVKLNIKIKTDYPWCSLLQPYPNTKIEEYVKNCKNIKMSESKEFQHTFFKDSVLDQPNMKEIVNLQKLFYLAVKLPILFPLIKGLLIKLPLKSVYNLIFLATFAYRYMRCHRMSPMKMLVFSIRNSRLYSKT
ncbi:MAG: B12-binding domain-containing radical SAM protein [Oligoflexia bacterium]|nr:B12-binding domain-containing radical SAM protein [Oligoflexia bacterium]